MGYYSVCAYRGKTMLKAYFNEKALHQLLTDHNYSMRGDIEENIGRIPTNAKQVHNSHDFLSKKEKARRYLDHVLQLLEDARKALIADIAQMQIELEKFISDRDEIIDRKNAISKVLDDLRDNGNIEIGEDGYPIDEKAKAAIKAWEQKTGRRFDANSHEAVDMLHYIILDLQQQESDLDTKIEDKINDIQEANELLGELDNEIGTAKYNGHINHAIVKKVEAINIKEVELASVENESSLSKIEDISHENNFVDVTKGLKF